jgi:iron-sulfur cluster repair protein YtfE (RIC family)
VELRRLAAQVEAAVGAQGGVGWDDCVFCDLKKLRATQEEFSRELLAHEAVEERVVTERLRRRLSEDIRKTHRTIERMLGLLRALSSLCDGQHVHSIRTAARRLREELEEHLAYEEKVLFPALRAAEKPASRR